MWRYTVRKINGKRRYVKVRSLPGGREQVRVVGHRNTTDINAGRKNMARRIPAYGNTTDANFHASYRIRH